MRHVWWFNVPREPSVYSPLRPASSRDISPEGASGGHASVTRGLCLLSELSDADASSPLFKHHVQSARFCPQDEKGVDAAPPPPPPRSKLRRT